jgi:ABC-type dipeptide/oligopeptide/nickel transport system ATPase component
MLAGEIVETIPADRSIADARHEYTRALMQAVPKLETLAG